MTLEVYIGQTRSRALIADLAARGWGEATQPDEWPPRRLPVMADNGAFKAWRAGAPFDGTAYGAHLDRIAQHGPRPRILVVPDLVAGGRASLDLSRAWAPRMAGVAPLYLVVQDGMDAAEVVGALEPFRGRVRRRDAAVEDIDGCGVGPARARARAALPHRARRHAGSRRLGAADRRRLDRLVPAAVVAGEPRALRAGARQHTGRAVRGVTR